MEHHNVKLKRNRVKAESKSIDRILLLLISLTLLDFKRGFACGSLNLSLGYLQYMKH